MAELDLTYFASLQENLQKISLENITSVSLNTDALKMNFEVIVDILKGLVKRADAQQNDKLQNAKEAKDLRDRLEKLETKQKSDKNELNERISSNENQIGAVNNQTGENTKDIENIQASLKELRDSHNDFMNAYKNSENDLKGIREKLKEHDRQIQELLSRGNTGSAVNTERSSSSDKIDHLKQDLSDMKNQFDDQISALHKLLQDYVTKDEFNGYRDQTDNKIQSHQESIDDLYNQLKALSSSLSDKLGCDSFDEHITDYINLKNIVINLANNNNNGESKTVVTQQVISSGAALSTKDANLLKELGQKFPELEALVKKLEKNLSEHLLTYKTFADEAWRKIAVGEENVKNLRNETSKKIGDVEAAIKALRDQLLNLQIAPVPTTSSSSSGQGSGIDSTELRRLQMAISTINERLSHHDSEIAELKKFKDRLDVLGDIANENRNRINAIEEELSEMKTFKLRIETLEQISRERRDSNKKLTRLNSNENANAMASHGSSGGVTMEQVRQLVDSEINKLRDEIMEILEEIRAALERKVDYEDLQKSEAALLEKLDQIAGALMKRAQADKNDTKKALMFLEKKIKEIAVIVLGSPGNTEEGAIFAKKPWTPWSCASCDNKLKDYPGALIDHKNWNKMPTRETDPNRITQGKFGKGWARWTDAKRMSAEKGVRDTFPGPSSKGMGELPEINRGQMGEKGQESSRME